MRKCRFLLLLLLAILSIGNALAIDQIGVAYRYNGKKQRTPLGGVYIKVATSPNGVVSQEENGLFVLKLKDRDLGDAMGDAIVQKSGMIVFNKEEVKRWHVQKDALVLIVCDADAFQKQKNNLIAIGRSQAEKKYKQKLEQLKAQNAKQQLSIDQYYSKLDSIEKERNNALAHMEEYADMFARIDESEIDTLAQRAIELFNQGQLEESIKLFEQGNYLKKLDDALKVKAQAADLRQKADSAEMLANKDIDEYTKSIQAQVAAYKMNNEWIKAGELLKGLADRLQTPDAIWDYAYFAQIQNMFTEAEKEYELYIKRILSNTNSQVYEPDLAASYNNLGELYRITQRFNEAEQMYKAALEIRNRLAGTNPQAYEPYLAQSYNNLAILYNYAQRFNEAEQMNKTALEICKRLANANPQAYEPDLAQSYNNLAILYSDTQCFNEAEQMYKDALEIFKRLADAYPQAYEPYLAGSYNNFANLYMTTQRFNEAEQMNKDALEIYKRLANANPQAYEPYLAISYNNLANLYYSTQRFNEAEQMYKVALEIRKRLAYANPQAYEHYLAASYNDLAVLYSNIQRFNEAEQMYKVALEIQKRLAYVYPQVYEPNLAMSYNNLAVLYCNTQRFNEAEQMHKTALEIRKRLADANPQAHKLDLAKSYIGLALLYNNTHRFNETEQMYKAALEIFKRLANANPKTYEPYLTDCYVNLSYVSILTKQFTLAETYSKEALEVDSTKHIVYSNLAAALLFQGKYQEAEKIYRQYNSELKEGFLSDFEEFAKAGVIPKNREEDVENIKKILEGD